MLYSVKASVNLRGVGREYRKVSCEVPHCHRNFLRENFTQGEVPQ
jgi:hypothetical protein